MLQNALTAYLAAARHAQQVREQAATELREAVHAANVAYEAKVNAAYDALDEALVAAKKEAEADRQMLEDRKTK